MLSVVSVGISGIKYQERQIIFSPLSHLIKVRIV